MLPLLKFRSPVWGSAAKSHLRLLDRAVFGASFLLVGFSPCDISYRRQVAASCVLKDIYFRDGIRHILKHLRPERSLTVRDTRVDFIAWVYPCPCSVKDLAVWWTKIPSAVALRNLPDGYVFAGDGMSSFGSRFNRLFLY